MHDGVKRQSSLHYLQKVMLGGRGKQTLRPSQHNVLYSGFSGAPFLSAVVFGAKGGNARCNETPIVFAFLKLLSSCFFTVFSVPSVVKLFDLL